MTQSKRWVTAVTLVLLGTTATWADGKFNMKRNPSKRGTATRQVQHIDPVPIEEAAPSYEPASEATSDAEYTEDSGFGGGCGGDSSSGCASSGCASSGRGGSSCGGGCGSSCDSGCGGCEEPADCCCTVGESHCAPFPRRVMFRSPCEKPVCCDDPCCQNIVAEMFCGFRTNLKKMQSKLSACRLSRCSSDGDSCGDSCGSSGGSSCGGGCGSSCGSSCGGSGSFQDLLSSLGGSGCGSSCGSSGCGHFSGSGCGGGFGGWGRSGCGSSCGSSCSEAVDAGCGMEEGGSAGMWSGGDTFQCSGCNGGMASNDNPHDPMANQGSSLHYYSETDPNGATRYVKAPAMSKAEPEQFVHANPTHKSQATPRTASQARTNLGTPR